MTLLPPPPSLLVRLYAELVYFYLHLFYLCSCANIIPKLITKGKAIIRYMELRVQILPGLEVKI